MKSAIRSRRSALAVTTGGRMEPVSRTVRHVPGYLLAKDGDSTPQARPEGSATPSMPRARTARMRCGRNREARNRYVLEPSAGVAATVQAALVVPVRSIGASLSVSLPQGATGS